MSAQKEVALRRRGWTVVSRVLGISACWEWDGTLMANGYGYVHCGGKLLRAHRVSYEVFRGDIPAGQVVRHRCNNKRCVNPHHLELGSQQQNLDDMVKARRSANGERNARAVLTDEQVVAIRQSYASGLTTYRALGEHYGVSESTIGLICRNRKRQHPTYRFKEIA